MYFVWVPYDGSGAATYHDGPVVLHAADGVDDLQHALAGLSSDCLESAWVTSGEELAKRPSGPGRMVMVRLRGLILDEVERRSPRRYRRWLGSGGPRPRRGRCRVQVMD